MPVFEVLMNSLHEKDYVPATLCDIILTAFKCLVKAGDCHNAHNIPLLLHKMQLPGFHGFKQ